jgi:adenylate kinase
LIQRSDETAEVIEQRLVTYHQKTEPLFDYYADRGVLLSVDGSGAPGEVFQAVARALMR